VSREWHDLLARIVGVTATGDVSASVHHHDPGGASGWPHNDLNPGWFAEPAAGPDEVRLAAEGDVGYHHGTRPEGVPARETVRAVSLLFYLANPPWSPGDGGETGLYESVRADRPSVAVPPVNNSLVAFECTPFSYHGFISNHRAPRNSVVMWLHRDRGEAVERWGEQSIVSW
jgi:2OG-Fe(II) oxygenase superfamily